MLAKAFSCALVGLEGAIVEVEVDISPGLPSFTIVGLGDTAVQEARERVRAAIRNSGFSFPCKRITVNLAPADLKKAGPSYDLPIALAILLGSGQCQGDVSDALLLGELSLDGSLKQTNGILPMVAFARDKGIPRVFVPDVNAAEAGLVENINIGAFNSLRQIVSAMSSPEPINYYQPLENAPAAHAVENIADLAYIKGQEHIKRALEVAAAGAHNLVMTGPPGSGKTLLARALPTILPPMTRDESLEVTKIYSVSGLLPPQTPLVFDRPFRSPHYTISNAGLVGGGSWPKPGEITLSHRGVLFLDELPEFGQARLELLRQPLEDKVVTISRARGSLSFPSNFMLIGAMNPCPCGYYDDPVKTCTCSAGSIARYQQRLSGPFTDRIDIFVNAPRVNFEKLTSGRQGESSKDVQKRVSAARNRQLERFKKLPAITNAEMSAVDINVFCNADDTAMSLLKEGMRQLHLSARAFHRTLKLGRTIADLDGSDTIKAHHIAEAMQYRPRQMA